MAIPIFPFFPEMLNGIGPECEMRFREVQSANRSVKNMPIFVKHRVNHQHFALADDDTEKWQLGMCRTSLVSLIPSSRTGIESASSNVVILRPVRLQMPDWDRIKAHLNLLFFVRIQPVASSTNACSASPVKFA